MDYQHLKFLHQMNMSYPTKKLHMYQLLKINCPESLHKILKLKLFLSQTTLVQSEGDKITKIFKSFSNIVVLDIEVKYVFYLPNEIVSFWKTLPPFQTIQCLAINHSELQMKLPEMVLFSNWIGQLTQLKVLTLYLSNSIHKAKVEHLFGAILKLENLQSLDLSLGENYLSTNKILSLGKAISTTKNLVRLSLKLQSNNIQDNAISSLISCISALNQLSFLSLDLSFNDITKLGMDQIFQGISNQTSLQQIELNLLMNSIECESIQYIPYDLKSLINLREMKLILTRNKLKFYGVEQILLSLKTVPLLYQLELNIVETQIDFQENINFDNLLSELSSVQKLILYFDKNKINNATNSLSSEIAKLTNLKDLDLSMNQNLIESIGMELISIAISNLVNLTHLTFRNGQNTNKDNGVQHVFIMVEKLINLKVLNLEMGGCEIEDSDIQILSKSLQKLENLSELILDFRCNSITNQGSLQLAEAIGLLSNNISHLTLSLVSNYIGYLGAEALALMIMKLYNLQTLSFQLEPAIQQKRRIIKNCHRLAISMIFERDVIPKKYY